MSGEYAPDVGIHAGAPLITAHSDKEGAAPTFKKGFEHHSLWSFRRPGHRRHRITAPGCFARIVLRRAGLDTDRDLECQFRSPGDYRMHLRRLRAGELDAALVGRPTSRSTVRRCTR